jgi:fatty-acyl-CoA synthase
MCEVVAAWIRPKAGETLTGERGPRVPPGENRALQIPQHVRIVNSFPMTVTGKVQKFRVREREIEALGVEGQIAATA